MHFIFPRSTGCTIHKVKQDRKVRSGFEDYSLSVHISSYMNLDLQKAHDIKGAVYYLYCLCNSNETAIIPNISQR